MAALEEQYVGRGYGDLKQDTAELVTELIRPIRQRVDELMADQPALLALMDEGAAKASVTAHATLELVYDRVGFVPLPR